jgi:hypothetical protein
MINHVELLVEEPSAEAMLRSLLPRFLTDVSFNVHAHQGKPDLLAKLPGRLNGYARFLPDTARVVVLIDRDDDDCHELKDRLIVMATTSSFLRGRPFAIINRVAIEELEAWYFGDWDAVRQVYPRVNAAIPRKRGYRDPDAIAGGTWEAFERVLQSAGYMKGGLRKTEAAREVGKHLDPLLNTSTSFRHFWDSVTRKNA